MGNYAFCEKMRLRVSIYSILVNAGDGYVMHAIPALVGKNKGSKGTSWTASLVRTVILIICNVSNKQGGEINKKTTNVILWLYTHRGM